MNFIMKLLFVLALAAIFFAADVIACLFLTNRLTEALSNHQIGMAVRAPVSQDIHTFTIGAIVFFVVLFFIGDIWKFLWGE